MFIVQIAGRLGKDPETRFTPSGQKVTSFNVATNQRKGKEDVTVWVRITVWGDRLDKIISYLKKGSAVVIIGKMTPPSSYVDKEGRTQFSLEVTAEMIEFSPFGKEDRLEGSGTSSSSSSEHSYDQEESYQGGSGGYGRNSGHGGRNQGGQGQGGHGGYGSQSMAGQGAQISNHDADDALPF